MSQRFHVVQCFQCETFQVHIVKKIKKWDCKMCGVRQSLKHVFGEASAKDCRLHVQKLNELRMVKQENMTESHDLSTYPTEAETFVENVPSQICTSSKWAQFLDVPEDTSNIESDCINSDKDIKYVLEKPSKRRKYYKHKQNKDTEPVPVTQMKTEKANIVSSNSSSESYSHSETYVCNFIEIPENIENNVPFNVKSESKPFSSVRSKWTKYLEPEALESDICKVNTYEEPIENLECSTANIKKSVSNSNKLDKCLQQAEVSTKVLIAPIHKSYRTHCHNSRNTQHQTEKAHRIGIFDSVCDSTLEDVFNF